MKTRFALLLLLVLCGLQRARAAETQAQSILPGTWLEISSIHVEGTNVVVTVQVSAGFKRVTLEARPRVDGGVWEPVAVERPGEFATPVKMLTFRVPLSRKVELLRVRGDTSEPLPASFYAGTSTFAVPGGGGFGGGITDVAVGAPAAPARDAATPEQAPRAVLESDIWKIEGDTLYFFNQYRGLQVLDIARPDAPVLRGTFNLPAAGEQMYVLDGNKVVLLARDRCGYGAAAQSELFLLEANDGQPRLLASAPVSGVIKESRIVGTALYVVSEQYRPIVLPAGSGKPEQQIWEWGSHVASFDLSRFAEPKAKSTAWVPGYGNAIMATDRFLFVAVPSTDFRVSNGKGQVRVFDISSPDGTMAELSSITVAGQVKDKFKMHLDGTVFTVVTENWVNGLKNWVETFSLADPKSPQPLGSLLIVERERLHATRFDGKRLYVVTFFQVDPLWVIDLSDPARLKKLGELEIPGWSTYMYVWEGRLVTTGIDNTDGWRTAVQLFDVRDPAKPALVSKVLLGERYSSSEANRDEKAFTVLPEHNLVLVPFTSWDKDKYTKRVQIIDLHLDGLRKRGAIEHQLEPRRATMHREHILSISGLELLSVNAANRDDPRVVASVELSWAADRVFLEGDHLLELASTWNTTPVLHVVPANDPTKVLKRLTLPELPLLGATAKDRRLYVLQGKSTELIWAKDPIAERNPGPTGTNQAQLTLSVYDLTRLPELPLLGQTKTTFEEPRYWSEKEALWPKPGLLVWSSGARMFWPVYYGGIATDAAVRPGLGIGAPIWWGGGSDGHFIAYDVKESAAPALASALNLRGTNNWWSFSRAFVAEGGLVYVSHQTSEFDKNLTPPPYTVTRMEGTNRVEQIIQPPPGVWVQKHYLDVINYADPKDPSVRKPVNIPGTLIGLSHQGAMLYTQGYRHTGTNFWNSPMKEFIEASAYDGVAAHLVDSLALPEAWPRPVTVHRGHVFLGRPAEVKDQSPAIEIFAVPNTGKFTRVNAATIKAAAQSFETFGDLLAVQTDRSVQLLDASATPNLRVIGSGDIEGCVGYNLRDADGAVTRGLWVPLGQYGVVRIPAQP